MKKITVYHYSISLYCNGNCNEIRTLVFILAYCINR